MGEMTESRLSLVRILAPGDGDLGREASAELSKGRLSSSPARVHTVSNLDSLKQRFVRARWIDGVRQRSPFSFISTPSPVRLCFSLLRETITYARAFRYLTVAYLRRKITLNKYRSESRNEEQQVV